MLISVSSFGKRELESPAGAFYSGCVKNVSGAVFVQCFSAAHSVFGVLLSPYQEVQTKVCSLVFYTPEKILCLVGLVVAENIHSYK